MYDIEIQKKQSNLKYRKQMAIPPNLKKSKNEQNSEYFADIKDRINNKMK